MHDAANFSVIQIPLGFSYYLQMQVMTGKCSDAQIGSALLHEIISHFMQVASHLLGYNVFFISIFTFTFKATAGLAFSLGLVLGLEGFFYDPTLHSLKEECIYIHTQTDTHTYLFLYCVFLAYVFSLK